MEEQSGPKMRIGRHSLSFAPLFFFLCYHHLLLQRSHAFPNTTGYPCPANQSWFPCQTYIFYRGQAPGFLDLASIGDLFSVSRLQIAQPSNVSNASLPLVADQQLFVPVTCSCNFVNSTVGSISYANLSYTILGGDTFYLVSTQKFENLTAYQSVEAVNPNLVATNLSVGDSAIFPIFCKCPNKTQVQNRVNYLVSYVLQPSDNISSIASTFGVDPQAIVDENGNSTKVTETLFIPVNQLPVLTQPITSLNSTNSSSPTQVVTQKDGINTGLAIGLGVIGFLLLLVVGVLFFWLFSSKKKPDVEEEEKQKFQPDLGGKGRGMELNLMADVSDCLDKYRVFGIEELNKATDGFSEDSLIQGTVYKGRIGEEVYAIKKMKWNAYEQLKILQKVNHGNLVKLEGFCVDPEDASCYLIYEYVENGSLYSWLHGDRRRSLSWKTRVRIAIDIANGLQYIHEHTRPRVVHKDIKSSNILLDSNMRAKIANFGLAKSGCNAITMHIVGTQGYIAPEYIADGVVSTKMDVFSFGVVLLELVSGREAIDEEGNVLFAKASGILDGTEEENVERIRDWADEVLHDQSCSVESVMDVMAVAVSCLQKDPTKRPNMVEIVYSLCKSDAVLFDVSDDGLPAPLPAAR